MSAMKPDGYAVQMDTGNFVGIWQDKDIAESVCAKQPASHHDTVEPMFTLATVRKWLEEEPSEAMIEAGDKKYEGTLIVEEAFLAMLDQFEKEQQP